MAENAFIDIAVLDPVRGALLAGDAVIVFDGNAQAVIWANGKAASLFGFETVAGLMDDGMGRFAPARRQILAAARSSAELGAVLIRVTSGMSSQLLRANIQPISTRDGQPLIAAVFGDPSAEGADDLDAAISGLDDENAGTAVFNGDGAVLAANGVFATFDLSNDVLAALGADLASQDERVVKRLIAGQDGLLPVAAGAGTLRDGTGADARYLFLGMAMADNDDDADAPDAASEDMVPADEPTSPSPVDTVVAAAATESVAEIAMAAVTPADEDDEPADDGTAEEAPEAIDAIDPPEEPGEAAADAKTDDERETAPVTDSGEEAAPPGPGLETATVNDSTSSVPPSSFSFEPLSGPIRFVWKMDQANVFREISPEFVRTVGPAAANVLDKSFDEVDAWLSLDPDGDIGASLKRRDTWSGKTVLWPIENTDLRVPVDLAALPYYSRDRAFEGYRGFGVIRVSDAVVDPLATGQMLHNATGEASSEAPEPSTNAEETAADQPGEDADVSAHDDPFAGEPPVLASAQINPVQLTNSFAPPEPVDDEQSSPAGRLDPKEQEAFDRIGRTLADDDAAIGEVSEEPVVDADDPVIMVGEDNLEASAADDDIADTIEDPVEPALDDETFEADAGEGTDTPAIATEDEPSDDADLPGLVTAAADDAEPVAEAEATGEPWMITPLETDDANKPDGLDADLLDGLPLALLMVRDEQPVFGNTTFQVMTGYETIEELTARGGLATLFDGPSDTATDVNAGTTVQRPMTLVAADGERFAARAHMQIVPFEGARALMFAFEPVNLDESEDTPYVRDRKLGRVVDIADNDTEPRDGINPQRPVAAPANVVPLPVSTIDSDGPLRARVEELESILDIATDGIVILQTDGTIRSVNGPGAALFGYDRADLEGKSFSLLFAHESQRAAMDYMYSMTNNGVASILNEGREVLGREQNGGFLPLFMTMGRLPASDTLCAVMRDITPWKQSEQAMADAKRTAEEASASKSEFLAKISHEIRTPLNAIIGFSELIQEERFGALNNPRYKDYLADINKSGRHVLDLVNDLLDLSKIEAGKQDMSFEGVDLNDVTADAISMVQPQASRARILIRSSLDPAVPPVVADMRSVRQITLNLLSNSIRFTHSGGLIVASTSYTPKSGVTLRIKDTGIGMTAKEIEMAMQPFQQVAEQGTPGHGGTGLGLPLTKALVEANRAEFTLHSEPGRGTIVEILFPESRVLTG